MFVFERGHRTPPFLRCQMLAAPGTFPLLDRPRRSFLAALAAAG